MWVSLLGARRLSRGFNFSGLRHCVLRCWVVCALAVCGCASVQAAQLQELFDTEQYPAFLAQAKTEAQAGNVDALFLLGKAYDLGRGVKQDTATARRYYLQADELGSARAANNLGVLAQQQGHKSEAIAHFKRALARGLQKPTWANLARAYQPPPTTDIRQAPRALWLSRLAADAYVRAWEQQPSVVFVRGAGRWYLEAFLFARAVQGLQADSVLRAWMAEEGDESLSLESFRMPDLRDAATEWLKKGAAENDGASWANYGVLLFEDKKFAEAHRAFERGAALNHPVAYYYLGALAAEGKLGESDAEAAAHYFEESLRLGEERARSKAVHWLFEALKVEGDVAKLERGIERLEALAGPDEAPTGPAKVRLRWARRFVALREQARPLPDAPLYLRVCGLGLDQVYGRTFNLGRNIPWGLDAYRNIHEFPKRWKALKGKVDDQGCAVAEGPMPDEVRALIEEGALMGLWFPNYTLPLVVRQEQDGLVLEIAEPVEPIPFL